MTIFTFRTGKHSGSYPAIFLQLGPEPADDDPIIAKNGEAGWFRVLVEQANRWDNTLQAFVRGMRKNTELLEAAREVLAAVSLTGEADALLHLEQAVDAFKPPAPPAPPHDQDAEPDEAPDD